MSLVQESPFTCPQCGWEFNIPVWGSINIATDPQIRDAILSGEHFTFTCRECGCVSPIEYSCLYVDRDRKQIICLIPDGTENSDEAETEARAAAGELLREDEQFFMRIVTSSGDLREKILILDSGLDDRLVEICKGVALSQVAEGVNVLDIRFARIAGQRFLVLYCLENEGDEEISEQYVTGFDSFYQLI